MVGKTLKLLITNFAVLQVAAVPPCLFYACINVLSASLLSHLFEHDDDAALSQTVASSDISKGFQQPVLCLSTLARLDLNAPNCFGYLSPSFSLPIWDVIRQFRNSGQGWFCGISRSYY